MQAQAIYFFVNCDKDILSINIIGCFKRLVAEMPGTLEGAIRVEKIILRPPDPGRIRQLERKAEEYLERILEPRYAKDLQCYRNRALILVLILIQGGVTYGQARKLAVSDTGYNEEEFLEDFYIIEDYCITGGMNNGLGTGLPYGQTGTL